MKQTTSARRTLFGRATRLIGMLLTTGLLLVGAAKLQAQTPLYQWNFDGASGTGVPSITAGGGTLTTYGAGTFNGAGPSGAATDFAYWGTSTSDGATSAANISGLGTLGQMTVTFWIKPSVAFSSQQASARLLMLGNSTSYDQSAGNLSPGFSLALSGGTGLQYNVNNGENSTVGSIFSSYAANQWVFVVVEYDGAGNNAYYSSALGTAIGSTGGNFAIMTGTTSSSIGRPTMEPVTYDYTHSVGSITNTTSMALMVGNRNSGGRGFQGLMDDINVYSTLLTSNQLETLRKSSLPSVLTAGTPTLSVANPVPQGTMEVLSGAAIGGTAPYTYQWQTDGGTGGTLTNIPGATFASLTNNTTGSTLGNFQYQIAVHDSAAGSVTSAPVVVNVIEQIPGTLAGTGNVAPSPGSSDASQLVEAGGYMSADSLNYYTDNGINNNKYCGQTFTTGSNAKGYTLNSLAIGLEGGGASGTAGSDTSLTYDLFIYQISTDGSTATLIADVTNHGAVFGYPDWAQWNFSGIVLTNNASYGYGFGRRAGNNVYIGMATSPGGSDYYPGGQIAAFPANGGAVVYGSSGYGDTTHDGVFDVGLVPNGVPFLLGLPTATPNPAYALSPVNLTDAPTTAGVYTYKWLTDNGSGGYNVVSGATATNLTVVPPDLNPGGADYSTNYYFVATRTADSQSVTGLAVTLTIHAASAPLLTVTPAVTNLVTFAGDARAFSVTEIGTLPITNQWLFNNGSGYVGLTLKTNTTLTLTNLPTTASGNYEIGITNLLGNTNTSVTLTVLPALTVSASSQAYAYVVYTNHPWAYWRLNETNDPTVPGAPTYTAYDYSGHGFDPVYGTSATVNNTGPQPPAFPGMATNELAAGTTVSTANAYLTPPSLNLTGNSNVTFMAWINPASGGQAANTGLLFNRNGPDNGCGFGFGGDSDELGYTWNNNNANTYSWPSGLYVADSQWNFVAYVISPTNATIYLGNLNGGTTNFLQANNPIAHTAETFVGGTVCLGGDSVSLSRTFNGLITEVSLFTNALSTAQVQQYFLVGIGAQVLAPTVPSTTVLPAAATTSGVYSGQNVRLTSIPTGTSPLSLQWQAGPDGNIWTNVPAATNSMLLFNPFTVGTIYYQLVVTNSAGAVTNTPVTVTFNALPNYPTGLWTANFQETNNIGAGQNTGGGVGHYVGRGILGNGTYWNIMPHVLAAGAGYASSTITNITSFKDDGVTSAGISCQLNNGGSYNSLGSSLTYSADIGNLLDQFYRTYYSPNALQFAGMPDGTYNLTCYAGNGVASSGANNFGSTFVLHAANGLLTNSTAEPTPVTDALSEGVNFVTFTGVHITGGALNADIYGNTAADPNASATIEGAQIQLVAYDPPGAAFSGSPTNGAPPLTVAFTNSSTGSITNSVWTFGDGSSVTNSSTAGVTHSYGTLGTYTVTLAVTGPGGTSSATQTSYITVGSAVITPITITKDSMQINGSGAASFTFTNAPGLSFSVRATNNLAAPVATWPVIGTPVESPAGTYNFTDPNKATNATLFYIISQP